MSPQHVITEENLRNVLRSTQPSVSAEEQDRLGHMCVPDRSQSN